MVEPTVSLNRYAAIFAGCQALAILFSFALLLVDVDVGNTNILGAVLSAIITGHLFVRQQCRAPTKRERVKLSWLSLIASFGVSIALVTLYLAVVATPEELGYVRQLRDSVSLTVWVVVLLAVMGFYFCVFYVVYAWYCRLVAKSMARKGGAL